MMFMTAKVDIKKTLLALAAAVALIVGIIFLFGGMKQFLQLLQIVL